MPGDDARFGQAWLTVRLTRNDAAAPPAVAWSLAPLRAERPVTQSRTLKLGAKLALEAAIEVQSSGTRNEVFLEAYGLQEPACTWEFTRTSLDEIRGTHRLALVARTPHDAPVTGTVDLRATLTRKRLGMLPYRVALDNGSQPSFALNAEGRNTDTTTELRK
jgi:hypothetical protein